MRRALSGMLLVLASSVLLASPSERHPQDGKRPFDEDEARKPLVEVLGGPFILYRDKVMEELKLEDDQKRSLLEKFSDYVQETMAMFEKLPELKPEERNKFMHEHCQKSGAKFTALLENVLQPKQRERLFQIQLQQAGLFALLGENEAFLLLKITVDQRKQFRDVVVEMEKQIERLVKESAPGTEAAEIMPKVTKLRREHEAKLKAILSEAQRKEWTKLVGKPFELEQTK